MSRGLAVGLLAISVGACQVEGEVTSSAGATPTPSIQAVKRAHEEAFLAMPGVVSVGLGLDAGGQPAIVVGLDRPRPETSARLPQTLEGYPVVVTVVGTLRPQ